MAPKIEGKSLLIRVAYTWFPSYLPIIEPTLKKCHSDLGWLSNVKIPFTQMPLKTSSKPII